MTNLRTFFFQNQRLYLVLTFVVVAFISACGGGNSVMDSASSEQKLSDQTIIVAVVSNYSGNVYIIDDKPTPVLELVRGVVYTFVQSNNSNTNHPIAFRDAQDARYITGVVSSGTPGQSGAKTVFTVPLDAPESLRYYCTFHGNSMGNTIKIIG